MSIELHSPISAHANPSNQPATMSAGHLTVSDLSLSARRGVRGGGARDYLSAQGFTVPDGPNQLANNDRDGWVMALSSREYWLLYPRHSAQASLVGGQALAPDAWPLYCQHSHAWLMLFGEPKAALMATLCGVDLRSTAFPIGRVAQTQVARVGAIVAHHDWLQASAFSLFVDQSYAGYLWEVLADALAEYR